MTLLMFVVFRFARQYRRTSSALIGGFLASSILLLQAQISMTFGTVWLASWWEYHVLMLAAFVAAVVALVMEYGHSGSVQGMVEGLLVRDTIEQLERGYGEVIAALVATVEAKDPYTRGHTQRVSELSVRIAQDLHLAPERVRVIGQAAMLHDIGKIAVPDSILNKPGRLTDEEFAVVKEHPARGYEIIRNVRSLQRALGGIRHHHERIDGSGYPDGLRGDDIPLDARIIAVADVFDALTSTRSYRAAWSVQRAFAVLDEEAGTKLDRQCVLSLKRVVEELAVQAASVAAQETVPVGVALVGSD
jgi:HD-GYP domain-containing protein (c-di-GMP phosphodiesterase class II)